MSFNCQSSFGPPAGHCLSRPVSFEFPSRSGPRHCGQSESDLSTRGVVVTATVEKHRHSAARVVSNSFTFVLLLIIRVAMKPCRAIEVTEGRVERFRLLQLIT